MLYLSLFICSVFFYNSEWQWRILIWIQIQLQRRWTFQKHLRLALVVWLRNTTQRDAALENEKLGLSRISESDCVLFFFQPGQSSFRPFKSPVHKFVSNQSKKWGLGLSHRHILKHRYRNKNYSFAAISFEDRHSSHKRNLSTFCDAAGWQCALIYLLSVDLLS